MASDKQIEANQCNAQLSTGPVTEEGKALVSKNATKHGLLSSETVLHWESSEKFELLKSQLVADLKPVGEMEFILIERIASAAWRLRRAVRIETGLLEQRRYALNHELIRLEVEEKAPGHVVGENEMKQMIYRALILYSDSVDLGVLFAENANAVITLQRYENSLEKSFFKTIHELQRLQAARAGNLIPPPVTIDIHGP